MTKNFEQVIGKIDPAKASSTHAALVWGVGKPYVDPSALNNPPVAPSNRTFLPEAVAHVGRSTDPDWGDWEQRTLHYPAPPVEPKLTLLKLLELDRHKEPKPPPPITLSNRRNSRSHTEEKEAYEQRKAQWEAEAPERVEKAKERIEKEQDCYRNWRDGIEMHRLGVQALDNAFKTLTRAILDERISAYFRPTEGGKLQPLEPSVLTRSGVSVGAIRTGTYDLGDKKYHLFVDADELSRTFPLAGACKFTVEGVPLDKLSPHLQLMIAVALESGISENTYIETSQLAADMMARASSFGLRVGQKGDTDYDISLSQCEKLAPALRWPNARAGKPVAAKQKK